MPFNAFFTVIMVRHAQATQILTAIPVKHVQRKPHSYSDSPGACVRRAEPLISIVIRVQHDLLPHLPSCSPLAQPSFRAASMPATLQTLDDEPL